MDSIVNTFRQVISISNANSNGRKKSSFIESDIPVNIKDVVAYNEKYLGGGDYIDKDIASMAIKLTRAKMYTWSNINIYIMGASVGEIDRHYESVCYITEKYTRFVKAFYNIKNVNREPVTILIYLTNAKKRFPTDGSILTPKHINSGFTIPSNNLVVVYRKEELNKVLLHELTHLYDVDKGPIEKSVTEDVHRYFNMDPSIRLLLNESLTEFFAAIMNILFASVEPFDNLDEKVVYKLLEKERVFMDIQAKRVIAYTQLCVKNDVQKYREATNVIAYYVVKGAMFNQYSKYIEDYKTFEKPIFNKCILHDVRMYSALNCFRMKKKVITGSLKMTSVKS